MNNIGRTYTILKNHLIKYLTILLLFLQCTLLYMHSAELMMNNICKVTIKTKGDF